MTMRPFEIPHFGIDRKEKPDNCENLVEYNGVWMTEGEASARRMHDFYYPPVRLLTKKDGEKP